MNISKKSNPIFWEMWKKAGAIGNILNSRVKCHDCGTSVGEFHKPGCDMERCPCCNGQIISCGCLEVEHPGWIAGENEEGKYWMPPDSIRERWSGIMYEKEKKVATRDNRYLRWTAKQGWIPCDSSHPNATPDLNYAESKIQKHCPY